MNCSTDNAPVWLTTSRGIARIKHLNVLLGATLVYRFWGATPNASHAVVAWGLRPSSRKAQQYAQKQHLPLLRLEDGFLRSQGLGKDDSPLSIVIDDLGIYYDATNASRLETLITQSLNAEQRRRSQHLQRLWQSARVSKYNHGKELTAFAGLEIPRSYVLVIDQTVGDAAIHYGLANADSFQTMLLAALNDNPYESIVLKIHPDVIAKRKRGHFAVEALIANPRIQLLALAVAPAALLEGAKSVYVVTSQMGFEALLWGKEVHTFGMPFYAGWGLTHDALAAPARRQAVPLEQLIYAALIAYPRYLNPETAQRCEVETLIAWLQLQRQMGERFASAVYALQFSLPKRFHLRRFLAGSAVTFCHQRNQIPANAPVAVWANNAHTLADHHGQVLRLEDGFIRSVGLGADLIRPLSWVIDTQGIYYDASQPSDLETLLQTHIFDKALITRAKNLQKKLVNFGITKYNLINNNSLHELTKTLTDINKKIILVVGQVETDASIKYGSPRIKTNLDLLKTVRIENPNAYIIYKPHPDVIAGLRQRGINELETINYCDKVIIDINMAQLLELITEVHTMTSLTGFEALLRGKKVVCYGRPFYSGWGLTEDSLPPLSRRTRKLELDELVAGTLILYPTYVSASTNKFTTPERVLDELIAWRDQAATSLPWQRRALRQLLKLENTLKALMQRLKSLKP